jgi:hypothetical protein
VRLQPTCLARALVAVHLLAFPAACSSEQASQPDAATTDSAAPPVEAAASDAAAPDAAAPEGAAPDAAASDATTTDAVADGPASDASVVDAPGANDSGGSGEDAAADGEAGSAVICPTDGGVPNDLACTGLYSDWATKTVAADAVGYTPAYVLWSDGAQKSRWVHLPPGGQIETKDMDSWVFPVGTKVWKQFSVGGRRVETRLLWKTAAQTAQTPAQWEVHVYRWSSDEQSATLFDTGQTNVDGTTYEIPSTTQCYTCHNGRDDMLVGFDLIGLGAPGAQGITLADLVAQNRLTQAPPATTIAIPEDATGKAAHALGYLHVNCGATCHNANINADAYVTMLYMKLLAGQMYPDGGAGQVNQLDTYTTAVNKTGTLMPGGMPYMRIAPHDAAHSLVPLMALVRDPDAGDFLPMPPLVSHQPDTAGLAPVQAWINAL